MLNDDLIAFLQPAGDRFDPHAWRDATATITDIQVTAGRLRFVLDAPKGLYRGEIRTRDHVFDMQTANVDMVEVPSGRKKSVGPWDLDHLHNVMAVPMAKTWVNGRLTGGLWFAVPGPDDVRAGRLSTQFGFEIDADGPTEVVLEFVERDRQRIGWHDMQQIELRTDGRRLEPLCPADPNRPRVYVTSQQLPELRQKLGNHPHIRAIEQQAREQGKRKLWEEYNTNSSNDYEFELRALAGLLNQDRDIIRSTIASVVDLCDMPSWSARPDPLLMGGENDRNIGQKLYQCGLIWDWLGEHFTAEQKQIVLTKVAHYLRVMYDFTVLQRSYMGCPSADAHSTGAWNGTAIACMAFYEELEIARHALPLFHGLFADGLTLFPPGGKAKSATFPAYHLARYVAAANTFGGNPPELQDSPFLENLADTLMACFRTPNPQEMQRGKRTVGHRYLTAFLSRFYPTPRIAAIYHAFVEEEKRAAGDVRLTHFDLLYGPDPTEPAAFPNEPYFARDIGQFFAVSRTQPVVGVRVVSGPQTGPRAAFCLQPHNRSQSIRLANLEIAQAGLPIIVDVSYTNYGQDGSLANTMCFEDGGTFDHGLYLSGEVGAQFTPFIRRFYRGPRFAYIHAIVGPSVHRDLKVRRAERILVIDLATGSVMVNDTFAGDRPIRFGTHLHASGSITAISPWQYRFTGGQANLIAGIKGGKKDLSDQEHGEMFVTVLDPPAGCSIQLSEAAWVPPYIYGINDGVNEDPAKAHYPRYQRWRLQHDGPVSDAEFRYLLSADPHAAKPTDQGMELADGARVWVAPSGPVCVAGLTGDAQAVLHDPKTRCTAWLGATRLVHDDGRAVAFDQPVDVQWLDGQASVLAAHPVGAVQQTGWRLGDWRKTILTNPRSHGDYQAGLV